ncbi:MAG: hypothetical protein WC520_04240 [Candidatus Paceibacterota bacterium]
MESPLAFLYKINFKNLRPNPETIFIMFIAVMFDLIGYLLLFIGMDDFGLLDIVGGFIFGMWLLSRNGGSSMLGSLKQKIWGRFFVTETIEIVPYLGDIMPTWTLLVISVLNDSREANTEGEEEAVSAPAAAKVKSRPRPIESAREKESAPEQSKKTTTSTNTSPAESNTSKNSNSEEPANE